MTSSISSLYSQNGTIISSMQAIAKNENDQSTTQKDSNTTVSSIIDTVTLSAAQIVTLDRQQEKKVVEITQDEAAEIWSSRFGFSEGEHQLSGGGRQVVTVSGYSIEVFEYDRSGALTKKTIGSLANDTATLNSEVYGANRKLTQTLHVSVSGITDTYGDDLRGSSKATMKRSVTWYDDQGSVTRQLYDSMELKSSYSFDLEVKLDSLEKMAENALSSDYYGTNYYLHIQDFDNGKLSGELNVDQNGDYEKKTNYSSNAIKDQAGHSTEDIFSSVNTRIQLTNYDLDGNVLRQATFTDSMVNGLKDDDGRISQSINVLWYNKGELIRSSSGSLSMKEEDYKGISNRASLFQILDIDADEYASGAPKSASELLSRQVDETISKPDNIEKPVEHGISAYDKAGSIAEFGSGKNPYKVKWSDTVYVDGEIVAQREDTESAQKNYAYEPIHFRVGGGLTEDEQTAVLHSSSHHDESYKNGNVSHEATVSSHEFIQKSEDGPDDLRTAIHGTEHGPGVGNVEMGQVVTTSMDETDQELHAASERLSKQLSDVLDSFANMLTDPEFYSKVDEGQEA